MRCMIAISGLNATTVPLDDSLGLEGQLAREIRRRA
jgi:hypothetical protein